MRWSMLKRFGFVVTIAGIAAGALGCGYEFEVTGTLKYADGRPAAGIRGEFCCGGRCSTLPSPSDAKGVFVVIHSVDTLNGTCTPSFGVAKGAATKGTLLGYDT